MLRSFKESLEANLAEFKTNVLAELAKVEQALEVDAFTNSGVKMSSDISPRVAEKKDEEDRGKKAVPKQKIKKSQVKKSGDSKKTLEISSEADVLLDYSAGEVQPPARFGKSEFDFNGPRNDQVSRAISHATTTATRAMAMAFTDPIVVASCPESFHDEVAEVCIQNNFAKAFGMKGDMVDTLSGDDWVGKWEAKVVISAVTKARAMKTNQVKIICIQGGTHCDKEVAAQPRLKKAIVQEFGEGLRVGLEWLEMDEFRERYVLQNATESLKIYMCHKHSNSIDAVLGLKLQLEDRFPNIIFYNVGLEDDMAKERTEAEVMNSTHFLIFLTKGALIKQHVQSQILCALKHKRQILLVMETDRSYGGIANLDDEISNLDDDTHKEIFQDNMMIPWSRDLSVQEVSLDKIAALLTEGTQALERQRTGPAMEDHLTASMFHPLFHFFCNCAGVALPGAWRATYVVGYITSGFSSLLLLFALILSALPQTKATRDLRDTMYNPMLCAVVPWTSSVFQKLFTLQEVEDLLALHKNGADLRRRLHVVTQQLTYVGIFICVPLASFIVYQFTRSMPTVDEASAMSPFHRVVQFGYLVLWPLAAFPACIQGGCLLAIMHSTFFMLMMSAASSFSQLHPQIRDFGIQKSVEQGMIVHVTDSDFVRFQRMYLEIWKKARVVLRRISMAYFAFTVCWLINFFLHVFCTIELLQGKPTNALAGFSKDGWHLTVRTLLTFVLDGVLMVPFFYLHVFYRILAQWAARLTFTKSFTRVAVVSFIKEVYLDFPALPMSDRFRLDPSMTPYFVLLVLARWSMFAFEFYMVDC